MALEIQRPHSKYMYRIDPKDPRNVDRRENKHGARWYFYARRDTINEAKAALLQLERETPK